MEIVPTSITNFERSDRQLQAFWLFSMFVAGKNSDFASNKLHAIMELMPEDALPLGHLDPVQRGATMKVTSRWRLLHK